MIRPSPVTTSRSAAGTDGCYWRRVEHLALAPAVVVTGTSNPRATSPAAPSTIAHPSPGRHRTHIPRALAHAMSSSGRAESGSVTVSCASPARDGPRSVELASRDANGPLITAELVGAQPALNPDATIIADAPMSAGKRRRTSVMLLGAVGYVPTMFAGLDLRGRRRNNGRGELVRRLRIDPRSLLRRRDRCGRGRRGRRGGRRRGLGRLFFFLRATCDDHAHGGDRASPATAPRRDEANDFVSSFLSLSVYLHRQTAGITVHGATDSEVAPVP